MNISGFDLNRVKALYHLLEEAHVGRAASRLGITSAAASNALRRLREDFGDPLLVKRGRGLVRTRVGDELRGPARDVMATASSLLQSAHPFSAMTFSGELPVALSDHVAAFLLPPLDKLAREKAPVATLMISPIPLDIADWLKRSGGALIGPSGAFAATVPGDALSTEQFYLEKYVCVMRRGHRLADKPLNFQSYAKEDHVLVLPRGLTAKSAVDVLLESKGLVRNIPRMVPSFHLAIPIVLQSDLITTMPERNARLLANDAIIVRDLPPEFPSLEMKMIWHSAHQTDGRISFIKTLMEEALLLSDPG